METVPDNFLGLPPHQSNYGHSRFAVLPIPYEATSTFGAGSCRGPRAIITASQQVELYDHTLGREFVESGVATLEPLETQGLSPEVMQEVIFKAARRIVEDGKFLLSLGGEHSITAGLVRAVQSGHKNLSVLHIDAHADLRDEYLGTKWSHACAMRRVHELGVSISSVGIRNYSIEEADFLRRSDVHILTDMDCRNRADWIKRAISALTDRVYLTVDIDGFDPAYAPGTGTPEPGGLDWYQVTQLIQTVASEKQIVAADLVEVAPIPGQVVTEFLAAKLGYKIICCVQTNRTQ